MGKPAIQSYLIEGKPTRTRKPLGYSPEPYMGILPFLQTPANILSI